MPRAWKSVTVFALLTCAACSGSAPAPPPTDPPPPVYVPKAVYCAPSPTGPVTGSPLCSTIPGNIGDDPALDVPVAYNGIEGAHPTSAQDDVQTPFDNLSWQTFIALNWTKGKENQPAEEGLKGDGSRVWEGWPRVSAVFGNGLVRAQCAVPPGMPVFQIASNGKGSPVAQNEEYIQAATDKPAIDVDGNWTIYERRLNDLEVAYLKAPGGNKQWDLTTIAGQQALIKAGGTVNFPAVGDQGAKTGAIEIKAAWRVLDPVQHAANAARFYTVTAMLTVAPDLVPPANGSKPMPICAQVDLGLVAMHIIQKNPVQHKNLFPQWFWSTFEHVDNAPLAVGACDPTLPDKCPTLGKLECPANVQNVNYSFFNPKCTDSATNQPPTATPLPEYAWNATRPYAKGYLKTQKCGGQTVNIGTQISRCWQVYTLTDQLNTQWRGQLQKINSVFQNYMLVGTQWGADTTNAPDPKVPSQVAPNFLSNSVVETYLQTKASSDAFQNGSCVTCHKAATLPNSKVSSNLSFLPFLVTPGLVRDIQGPVPAHTQSQ